MMKRLRILTMAGLGSAALMLAVVPAAAHGPNSSHKSTVLVTGRGSLLATTPGITTGATSRANFALVVRQVGTGPVRGHTEFQIHTGLKHLTFSSTSESNLVVTGCTVTYGGTGRMGRARGFTFSATAVDAKVSGCTATKDEFAITITPPVGSARAVYTLALIALSRGSITLR
ncbi:MAG TPA: hypothetical protein VNN74_06680 [Candidatus Micrarchaeia archaeon]|nr:hypothetical protein [Candidatus Micrarchaeia archaeon]